MKHPSLLTAAAFGLLAAAPSHALFGLGINYGHNFAEVKSENSTLSSTEMPTSLQNYVKQAGGDAITSSSLNLTREKVSGLQQIGVKAWIDVPLTDISVDVGSNIAWGSYSSNIKLTGTTAGGTDTTLLETSPSVSTGMPVWGIKDGETPYINVLNDVTLRYTVIKLPPLLPIQPLKISVGAGVTLVYGTRVVGKDDVNDLLDGATLSSTESQQQLAAELTGKIKDKLYTTTWGGHLDLNVLFKVPVLPVAVYADGKWYLHTSVSDAATKYPFALTAGLAFAL